MTTMPRSQSLGMFYQRHSCHCRYAFTLIEISICREQGCQMVCFQTKNPNILEDLGMENAVIYSGHLEYFTTTGYIFAHLVIL
jgi:hypothetical protein